jgi:hypothetical protein
MENIMATNEEKMTDTETSQQTEEQRADQDRRQEDRRKNNGPWPEEEHRENVVDRRLGLDRRRGPGKRRSKDRKSAEEGQMSDEQFEFLMAIDTYKKANSRPFPTWTEVLEVIKALGYRKTAEPSALAECAKNAE